MVVIVVVLAHTMLDYIFAELGVHVVNCFQSNVSWTMALDPRELATSVDSSAINAFACGLLPKPLWDHKLVVHGRKARWHWCQGRLL